MAQHRCRACVVACMDFRLNRAVNAFLAQRGLERGGADVIRIAGAIMALVRPTDPRDRDWLLSQLNVSYELHGVREFHLINHRDCGAYGPAVSADPARELQIHTGDLRAARELVRDAFPDVQVATHLFEWAPRGS